jgi:hypothetical protein
MSRASRKLAAKAVRVGVRNGAPEWVRLNETSHCLFCAIALDHRSLQNPTDATLTFDCVEVPARRQPTPERNVVPCCHLCGVLRDDTPFIEYGVFALRRIRPHRSDLPALVKSLRRDGFHREADKANCFIPGNWVPSGASSFIKFMAAKDKTWATKLAEANSCFYCETPVSAINEQVGQPPDYRLTWDHIKLKKEGGGLSKTNLAPCCHFCNGLRGDRDFIEFAIDALHVVRPLRHDLPALARWFAAQGRTRDAKVTRSHANMTRHFEQAQIHRVAQGLPDLRPDWRKPEMHDAA